jgi:lysophospholipase L1-like esterase
MTKKDPTKVAPGTAASPRHRASPFLFNGKFDLTRYLKANNNGKTPDFITIQLGVNDVFGATDQNQAEVIAKILENADNLLGALRKEAPNAIIGVGLVTPGARTQDAFGSNYANGQTRWQYKKNQHALNAAMLKKFASYPDKKVFLIPTAVNLDCENNFPVRKEAINGVPAKGSRNATIIRQSNGVHPAGAGYHQMGDTFYCWLKYQLSK